VDLRGGGIILEIRYKDGYGKVHVPQSLSEFRVEVDNSSFAPPNYSSILYNFEWIDNCYDKISTGAILAKP